jgi:hypothetical protein
MECIQGRVGLLKIVRSVLPVRREIDPRVRTGGADHSQLTRLRTLGTGDSMASPSALHHLEMLPLTHDAHEFFVSILERNEIEVIIANEGHVL